MMVILAAAIGLACCAVILAEIVTRALYGKHLEYRATEDTLWELTPSQKGFTIPGRPKATINSFGFRGSQISLCETCYRILLVGDSFAFGYGVGDDETLARFVELDLTRRTGMNCQVLNLGVPGYGVHQMCLLAEKKIKDYRPQMVMMVMIAGDVLRQPEALRRSQRVAGQMLRALLRKSSFTALIKPRLERAKDLIRGKERITFEQFNQVFDKLWARDRQKIERLDAILKDHGVEFVFVPYASHERDWDFARLARSELRRDITVVEDIYCALERYSLEYGCVVGIQENVQLRIEGDGHPTATSYRIAAGVIAETLGKRSSTGMRGVTE